MKKFFEKLKELATKIANKAKETWGKLKDWYQNKGGKDKVQAAVVATTLVGGGISIGYVVGACKMYMSPDIQAATKWYNNKTSKNLTKAASYDYISWPENFDEVIRHNDGFEQCRYQTGDFIKHEAVIGTPTWTLSDYGAFGQRVMDMGYAPDTRVYSTRLNLSKFNLV